MNAPNELRSLLCEQWCAGLEVDAHDPAGIRIGLPLVEGDGDEVSVWLERELGGWKVTDHGTAMMRLSYHLDLEDVSEGARGRVLAQIVSEHGVTFDEGALSVLASEGDLSRSLLNLGQAMVRINDISLWTRQNVATQFYDDLQRELERIVGANRLCRDYLVPNLPQAESYPVDFAVVADVPRPFYIFGVPTRDKAKLATIVLQHIRAARQTFESLVVLQSIESAPKQDLRRLMNTADSMVDSLAATEALETKVRLRIAA